MQKITSITSFLKKHATPVLLTLILLLAFTLRAWGLGSNSFIADEFIDMNASYGYAQTGEWKAWNFNLEETDTLDPYTARDERSWIYRWQVASLFSVFPPTEVTARSVSVFWGLITTLIIFWSARIFTKDTHIALLSAFLFAVSITGIELDRKLRMYAMFTPVFLVLSTFLFLLLETKYPFKKYIFLKKISDFFSINLLWVIPVLLAGLLALHLQLLTVNIVFSLFGYFLAVTLLSHLFPKVFPKSISSHWGLGAFMLAIPVLLAFFPHIPEALLGTSKFFMDNYGYAEKILTDFQHPLLGAILALFGAYWLFTERKKHKESLWLLVSFFIPLLLTIFVWKRAQGAQYIAYAIPFVLILASTGIVGLLTLLRKHIPQLSPKTLTLWVFSLAILLLPNYGYFFEEKNTYHRGNDPTADYRKVFIYLKKQKVDGDALITRNFRNYYFDKWHAPVLEFGGERADHNLTQTEIQNFICAHPSGFVIIFDNDWDYVTKEGRAYVETTLTRIDHSSVRGSARAYRWSASSCGR